MGNKNLLDFLRKVVLTNDIDDLRGEALDLLLVHSGGMNKWTIHNVNETGTFFVLTEAQFNSIQNWIASGKKIQAIKELRDITRWGLKDSKDAVESPRNFKQRPVTY